MGRYGKHISIDVEQTPPVLSNIWQPCLMVCHLATLPSLAKSRLIISLNKSHDPKGRGFETRPGHLLLVLSFVSLENVVTAMTASLSNLTKIRLYPIYCILCKNETDLCAYWLYAIITLLITSIIKTSLTL